MRKLVIIAFLFTLLINFPAHARSQGEHGARWECKKGKLRLRRYDGGVDGTKWLPVEHLGED